MDKRRLVRIPIETATADMIEMADQLGSIRHIVTARLIDDMNILQLTFYRTSTLKKGKSEAAFRTFLSDSDYITQDLGVSKIKWRTASFYGMNDFDLFESHWNYEKHSWDYEDRVKIRSEKDRKLMDDFFEKYSLPDDKYGPWSAIHRFQETVKEKRLDAKRKKETDIFDAAMEPIREVPDSFYQWVWEKGMSFSRYLIYKETEKGKAVCECTHCKNTGMVDRKKVRLRNNEKGICPFCGSKVTQKAKGKMPARIIDERWFMYVDPYEDGFVLRYFKAFRDIRSDKYLELTFDKRMDEQYIHEYSRAIYSFENGKPKVSSYEWAVYKQRGAERWCPDQGKIACMTCILYPENLPHAWEHTQMKYSALEVMSANIPTVSLRYEDAIKKYLKFPKLEWICKMGMNNLAKDIINERYDGNMVGRVNYNGETIYQILGLTKVNTKILQTVDGNSQILRLLQVSQEVGLQFKPDGIREYYETFKCNTELLKQANRKVSLHKIVRYIEKESENYPLGEKGGCWQYAYMRYREREDPRIERKQNMAKDWLEYLGWCKSLKYDLNDMFFYMPKNFKKVHDRTAKEYQELQDRKSAEERRRREALAKKNMEDTKKAMEELFKKNDGVDAFSISGKGLLLVVPKDASDIKAEGKALHHCVGGYVERVARGETNIFFVRKAEAPSTPYFTMEFRDNHVVQCRGAHNCGMPPDVKAFVNVFEKKMQDAVLAGVNRKECG